MSCEKNDEIKQTILKTIDYDVGIITLVSGHLSDGKPYYAYASIKPSKYEAFKKAEKAGEYDLVEYGEILAHGEGLNPPQDVINRMRDEHGANHKFEEEIAKLVTN